MSHCGRELSHRDFLALQVSHLEEDHALLETDIKDGGAGFAYVLDISLACFRSVRRVPLPSPVSESPPSLVWTGMLTVVQEDRAADETNNVGRANTNANMNRRRNM